MLAKLKIYILCKIGCNYEPKIVFLQFCFVLTRYYEWKNIDSECWIYSYCDMNFWEQVFVIVLAFFKKINVEEDSNYSQFESDYAAFSLRF